MDNTKFLLVDDDKIFIFLATKTIQLVDRATEVQVFNDGLEILDHLKNIADKPELLPDVIFLDLNMPVIDGWGFLNEYVSLNMKKKIPIYLVSSSISPHDIERAKNMPIVTDFLIKPLMKEKVVEILANLRQ
jgi:CheY-like chemotaxis protein